MKLVFFLICASAFEQLRNDLKKLVGMELEPYAEMKMRSISPKMQKIRIYENVTPNEYPIALLRNVRTEEFWVADRYRVLNENVDLDRAYEGKTLVHVAARVGCTEIVKFLATKNVDLNRADFNGETPVWIASMEGHTEIVKFLARQGVDLNPTDYYGQTPVYKAAKYGRTEIVKFLATKNVDLNRADYYGQTPVHKAAQHGRIRIVKFLIEKNVKLEENLLIIAATEEIKQLIAEALKK